MPLTVDELFASVDANKITREVTDKSDYINNTFDFGTDTLESNGTYFIPEGEPRLNDKINYNFKVLADRPKPKYIQTNVDLAANDSDVILVDTTYTITQSDDIDISVVNSATYNVTIDSIDSTFTSTSAATLLEIQDGLINSINSKSFNVTAASTTTGIKIVADVSGASYVRSVSANLTILNSVQNKSGEVVITLNSSLNAKIEILDIKSNFATNKAILRSTDLIMNSSNDFNLITNNKHYTALFVDNNWRIF